MRSLVVSAALVAAFILASVAAGYAPAWCQEEDFSITNQEPVGTTPFRRDMMRQLQAWWDVHAYYPRHASNNDEGGTVKVHLRILPDGAIFTVTLVESSGSRALDAAGVSAFRTGAVRRFPEGEQEVNLDLQLHYVLAHRHDDKLLTSYKPTSHRAPFTIANDPVKSQILETMLQRTCTGTVTKNGGMNQPWRGMRDSAEVIFFRKPDGTPWAKFYETGLPISVSPVVEIGNMLQWVGPTRHVSATIILWDTYTVWPDGPNHLSGAEGSPIPNLNGAAYATGLGGPVDLTCSTAVLPTVPYGNFSVQTMVTTPGDPP